MHWDPEGRWHPSQWDFRSSRGGQLLRGFWNTGVPGGGRRCSVCREVSVTRRHGDAFSLSSSTGSQHLTGAIALVRTVGPLRLHLTRIACITCSEFVHTLANEWTSIPAQYETCITNNFHVDTQLFLTFCSFYLDTIVT